MVIPGARAGMHGTSGRGAAIGRSGDRDSRAIEPTVLSRCVSAITALKAREPSLSQEVRNLMSCAFEVGAVDYVVTSYRGSPDLLGRFFATRRPPRGQATLWRERRTRSSPDRSDWTQRQCDPVSTLSLREKEVFDLLCEGLSNREIAKRLFISLETVKVHARHVYDKLGIRSRTALALHAASQRHLSVDQRGRASS